MKNETRKRKHRPSCGCVMFVLLILLALAAAFLRKQLRGREQHSAESSAAEQSLPEHSRAEQSIPEQSRAEESRLEQSRAEQSAPDPDAVTPNAALCDMIVQAATDGSWQFEFDTDMLQCEKPWDISKTISATFDMMWEEHPELFYLDCKCITIPAADENGVICGTALIELQPLEEYQNQPVLEWYAETRQAAEQIIAQIPAGSSNTEKALFVHDYLVSHTVYDMDELLSGSTGTAGTVYGALVEHAAVCSGYSHAFMYLMQLLDIPCRYYSGESVPDETEQLPILEGVSNSHGWNCVWLDGTPYWVDVTWDDPVDKNGHDAGGPVRHDYCFVDDETILQEHIFDSSDTDLPVCTDRTLHERLFSAEAAS